MGALYLSVVVWAPVGEIASIFEPRDQEKPILAGAVEVDRYGFSIRPPADWSRKGGGAKFLAPPVGRFRNSLAVERFPSRGEVDKFAAALKSELSEKYEPFRVLAEKPFEASNLKGMSLTVDYTEFKVGSILYLRTRYYFIALEDSMIVAVGTSRREKFEDVEGLFNASVKSISIFGPGYMEETDGTCSFSSEGYSFRPRADMVLQHRQEDATIQLTVSSPGKANVQLQISRLSATDALRAQAKSYAARVPGADVSRYVEATYECWRILASKAESAIYYFLLGGKTDRFLIYTAAPRGTSDRARDVIEHIVKTFRIAGG